MPSSPETPATDLAERRWQLIQRSQTLRAQLVTDAQALAPVFSVADHTRAGVVWLRDHPLWVAVAVATLVALKPSRLWRWGGKAWTVWRFWQRIQNLRKTGPAGASDAPRSALSGVLAYFVK